MTNIIFFWKMHKMRIKSISVQVLHSHSYTLSQGLELGCICFWNDRLRGVCEETLGCLDSPSREILSQADQGKNNEDTIHRGPQSLPSLSMIDLSVFTPLHNWCQSVWSACLRQSKPINSVRSFCLFPIRYTTDVPRCGLFLSVSRRPHKLSHSVGSVLFCIQSAI